MSITKLFKILWRNKKGVIIPMIISLVVLVVLNYVRSLLPLFVGKVIEIAEGNIKPSDNYIIKWFNGIISGQDKTVQVLDVFIAIVCVGFVRDGLNLGDDILIAISGEGISYNMTTGFYNHIQALPFSYLNHCETGDLIQRATNDISRVKRLLGEQMPEILNNIIKLIIYSITMISIDKHIGTVIVCCVPVILAIGVIYFIFMGRTFEKMEKQEGELSTIVQENLTGIRVVKAFANEDLEVQKELNKMEEYTTTWNKMMNVQSFYWSTGDLFGYGLMLLTFVLGLYAMETHLDMSEVASLLLYVGMIIGPTRYLGRLLSELGRTNIAAKRILEIEDMPTEYELADGRKKPVITGNVEFKNVSFKFDDASIPTIDNVSFNVKQGQTVAILGKTGCGKSTLASLINRMLEISDGDILFDGVSIKDINKKYLRKNVGLVLQESFLFSSTIAENIGVAKEKFNLKEIQDVADIANVSTDIERFQNGYETVVGERGVTLSGGQKQRISIARTIVEHKPILIFDDSLSAVDTETDLKIRKALKSSTGKSTTFIITHRVVTAKDADVIIVMDEGKITNIGTHEELLDQEGLYKNIWHIQNYFNEGEVDING